MRGQTRGPPHPLRARRRLHRTVRRRRAARSPVAALRRHEGGRGGSRKHRHGKNETATGRRSQTKWPSLREAGERERGAEQRPPVDRTATTQASRCYWQQDSKQTPTHDIPVNTDCTKMSSPLPMLKKTRRIPLEDQGYVRSSDTELYCEKCIEGNNQRYLELSLTCRDRLKVPFRRNLVKGNESHHRTEIIVVVST